MRWSGRGRQPTQHHAAEIECQEAAAVGELGGRDSPIASGERERRIEPAREVDAIDQQRQHPATADPGQRAKAEARQQARQELEDSPR